jgi:hypothetical protein
MAVFKAFKPEAMNKIAKAMGYSGDMGQFQSYIEQDPMRQQQMQRYTNAAMQMAKGGVVKMRSGGAMVSGQPNAQFAATPMGGLNLQQAAPNFTGMTPVMNDPRGVGQDITGNNPMTVVQAPPGYRAPMGQGMGPLMSASEYLTGTKDQYDAFRKQYMQGGPRRETADVQIHPMQGFDFRGSSTEFGEFQDYLRGQQQAMDPRTAQQTGSPLGPVQGVLGNQNPVYRGVGATSQTPQTTPPAAQTTAPGGIQEATMQRMFTPGLPQGGVTVAATTPSEAGQYVDPRTGTLTGSVAVPTTMAGTMQAGATQEKAAATMEAVQAAPAVDSALQATQAAQGTVDPRAQVTAAQQTASSVGNLTAAQGNAILIDNPVQRQIQDGELISGAAADAQTAANFTEQIQAAEATPSSQATVQGQLAQLTANFDSQNPPAWAAGALRNATAQMAARGLGASSIAGQAIVQATIEAALPIAQADANVTAQFEAQNLSNRQQRAMLAAQQRAQFLGQEFDQSFQARVQNAAKISDIANQNFTAEQQVQLENSNLANTMNLNNLSNKQALVVAQASALANMDLSNLNNRQQASVQNAQSFLNMDMANLSNQQQTEMFKAQQRVQSLFTDQAATNAARQFNASSQQQVDQFFANLATQVQQFNASQVNAQEQFNAGQRNTVERFNAELNNQRDQFNAQNQLVISQNNAQWRREIATADTAAVNRANELNAASILDVSKTAYDNLWQYYADTMEWAWTSADNQLDRITDMAIAELTADTNVKTQQMASDSAAGGAIGSLIGTLGSAWISSSLCWVAREVYGAGDTRWFVFRTWMRYNAPKWLYKLYEKHGEAYAKFISDKPVLKWATKKLMDLVVEKGNTVYA